MGVSAFQPVCGEDHEVGIDDFVEGLEEIEDTERQSGDGVTTAVVGHIDMCIGKMKDFYHRRYRLGEEMGSLGETLLAVIGFN